MDDRAFYHQPYQSPELQALVHAALYEDLGYGGDITVRSLVDPGAQVQGHIIAKAPGVICGVGMLSLVLRHLEATATVEELCQDGDAVQPGQELLRFVAPAAALLMAERSALNLMQSASGVATLTRRYVEQVAGTRCGIYDTRKTAPGQRLLHKYAVHCGGGHNHRRGLFDQVLIKENHIALMDAAAGPAAAVARCRERLGPTVVIQVEIAQLEDLPGVIAAGADLVLLDNMDEAALRRGVAMRDELGCAPHHLQPGQRPVALEASGGITLDNLAQVASSGVERVSIGALTHSAPALDMSLLCRVC